MVGVKRVSFFKKSKDFFILHNDEELERGAELLRDYFWFFSTHDRRNAVLMQRSSCAYFYTYAIPWQEDLRAKGFEVEEINLDAVVYDNIFYDVRSQSLDLSLFPPQKVYYIFVNGKRAGVYFSQNQTLVGTDWTHNEKTIKTLLQIVSELSKIFKRKPSRPPKSSFKRLTFGGDPEFELVKGRSVVSASNVVVGGTSVSDVIGVDGAGSQVEIRPAPSSSIRQFIQNVRKVLMQFSQQYRGYSLSVQGDRFPLGGHIHISLPPNEDILVLLDNWIGKHVLGLSGVARGSYKKLSAYESKPWGFEYRTPPAAIFLHPAVLQAVLTIIKKVVTAYFTYEGVAIEPSESEIDRLGLNKEWNVLHLFVRTYDKMDKDVLNNWRVRKYMPKPKVEVIFRDDWDSEIRNFVKSLFSEKLTKNKIKKLNERGVDCIILFGFKQERGMVCNFKSKMFDRIDFSYSTNENERAFGLPYDVRVAELTDELKATWMRVVDEIVDDLLK